MLPSPRRHFHFGSTYARDLSKTKATIYLIWESDMSRKPDSLVTFYLLYFYIYGVLFSYFFDLLFSKTTQRLRCNLLFGFIGHFGLLKDINISFFLLSFFLQCISCHPPTVYFLFSGYSLWFLLLLTHPLSHTHDASAYSTLRELDSLHTPRACDGRILRARKPALPCWSMRMGCNEP